MSVFPLKFGTALRTIIYPLGDPSGRLGLLEIGLERGEQARQRAMPIDAPKLLFGDHEPGTDPAFDLIAGPPALHIATNNPDNRKRRLNDVGAYASCKHLFQIDRWRVIVVLWRKPALALKTT